VKKKKKRLGTESQRNPTIYASVLSSLRSFFGFGFWFFLLASSFGSLLAPCAPSSPLKKTKQQKKRKEKIDRVRFQIKIKKKQKTFSFTSQSNRPTPDSHHHHHHEQNTTDGQTLDKPTLAAPAHALAQHQALAWRRGNPSAEDSGSTETAATGQQKTE
jgi:hypothetical protein